MTPARTKIVLLSTLALGLLAGTLWFAWQPQSQSDPQSIGNHYTAPCLSLRLPQMWASL